MIEWGWAPKALWVDLDDASVSLGGEVMFNVKVEKGEAVIQYEDGWREYFTNESEWNTFVKNQQDKLNKSEAKKGESKGEGQIVHGK